mmetsp:Transcript_3828/g.8616  ORF Transcript_3828/g.8616 Transcript_3828/m.8616 type:complete len:262 (+) Transcript_3828:202-987(+)
MNPQPTHEDIMTLKSVRFTTPPTTSACPAYTTTTHHQTDAASSNNADGRRCSTRRISDPISLPQTHIRRTPSEIQLVDDTRNAEFKDIAMYSRLMMGMLHQIQHHHRGEDVVNNSFICSDSVHPLVKKTMVNIARTKDASDHELEHPHHQDHHELEQHRRRHNDIAYSQEKFYWDDVSYIPNGHESEHQQNDDNDDDGSDWDMHSPIDVEHEYSLRSSIISSLSSSMTSQSLKGSPWSLALLQDDESVGSAEDDCIFSMEM